MVSFRFQQPLRLLPSEKTGGRFCCWGPEKDGAATIIVWVLIRPIKYDNLEFLLCYNDGLLLKNKHWGWKWLVPLQHHKKCNIRSLWGHLPFFIYIFWLLWDQPSAHTAAAHSCFSSTGNILSSFPVAKCLLLPVDGGVPLDPTVSAVTDSWHEALRVWQPNSHLTWPV